LNQQTYRRLISGRKVGAAGLLWPLLRFAALGYGAVVRARNFLYSKGCLKVHHADAAVICVGNITTGGTGKTPLVVWVHRQIVSNFKSQISDFQCAILTRGYRSKIQESESFKDEVAILADSCPEAKVIVNPDRVAGAAEAISRFGAKVLIMDDGFQHRRLARDLDIVAVDATQPFGYGKMLPAGLLREPLSSLKRAHAAVITRCDQVAEADLDELKEKLRTINPNIVVARSIHAPVRVEYPEPSVTAAKAGIQKDNKKIDSAVRRPPSGIPRTAENDSIEQLKGKKVFAFCGIGNPEAFLSTLDALGCRLVGSEVYDDHYRYTQRCLADLYARADRLGADLILTTQKDWTKIAGLTAGGKGTPLAYLSIEIQFTAGRNRLTSLIQETLAGKISQGG
jgi:tetraacyldisaccharide 4'-kinase